MLLNELLKAIQPVQVTGDSRIEITGVNICLLYTSDAADE